MAEIHSYLEVWVEAEQEGFSCTVAVFTDSEWIRGKSSKHLKSTKHQFIKGVTTHKFFFIKVSVSTHIFCTAKP